MLARAVKGYKWKKLLTKNKNRKIYGEREM